MSNQKQIVMAAQMWAQENDEKLPTADTFWTSAISVPDKVKRCSTAGRNITNAYVYHSYLSGKSLADVVDPTAVFMVADGAHTGNNTNLDVTNVAYNRATDIQLRHDNKVIVGYVDGHVSLEKGVAVITAELPVRGGLSLWLDASALFAANGDVVSAWDDGSGRNHTAASTTGSRPTFQAQCASLNNKPAVFFPANGSGLKLANGFAEDCSKGVTVFLVFNPTENANSWNNVFNFQDANGRNQIYMQLGSHSTNAWWMRFGVSANFGTQQRNLATNPYTVAAGSPNIFAAYDDPSKADFSDSRGPKSIPACWGSYIVNGTTQSSKTLNTTDPLFATGSQAMEGNANPWDFDYASGDKAGVPYATAVRDNSTIGNGWPGGGYIGEMIVYNRALSQGETANVIRYLGKKFAITVL